LASALPNTEITPNGGFLRKSTWCTLPSSR
jgi:hypothetical protein